jgi:hypothetical protein
MSLEPIEKRKEDAWTLTYEPKSERKEGIWTHYKGAVWVKIRPLDKSILRELKKQATIRERQGGYRKTGYIEKVDPDLLEDLTICWVFEDWKGVVDLSKKPIPCTDEMKLDSSGKFPDFSNWGIDEAVDIADHYEERKATEIKNLNFTPAGSGHGPEA